MDGLIILLMKGVLVGFAIAAPVGAIGVLCIRRTLMGHYALGITTGIGSGFADVLFASIAAFGLASIADLMQHYEFWLKLIGGFLLIWIGASIFRSGPCLETKNNAEAESFIQVFVSAFFLTLTNPITVLAFVAVFAAMGIDHLDDSLFQPIFLVFGVGIGACGWWVFLSTAVRLMRHKLSDHQLVWINRTSGGILVGFAAFILASLL